MMCFSSCQLLFEHLHVAVNGWGWATMSFFEWGRELMSYFQMGSRDEKGWEHCSGDWSTSDHSNRFWTNEATPCVLLRTDPVRSWESPACLQLCSGSPVRRGWMPCTYRLAAQQRWSCLQWSPPVTCGEVRGWGGTAFFKANFAIVWIEWSSINSLLKWLLADWMLFMFLFHTIIFTHTSVQRRF